MAFFSPSPLSLIDNHLPIAFYTLWSHSFGTFRYSIFKSSPSLSTSSRSFNTTFLLIPSIYHRFGTKLLFVQVDDTNLSHAPFGLPIFALSRFSHHVFLDFCHDTHTRLYTYAYCALTHPLDSMLRSPAPCCAATTHAALYCVLLRSMAICFIMTLYDLLAQPPVVSI